MASKLETFLVHLFRSMKLDVTDYCDIETVEGNECLVMSDGSLATILEFSGKTSVLGRGEFDDFIKSFSSTTSTFFNQRGHILQFVFVRDFIDKSELENSLAPQKNTAGNLQLDIDDIIDETIDVYSKYVYSEKSYIVLWSKPALLDNLELKLSKNEKDSFRKEHEWPSFSRGQNLLRPISYLRDRHLSFVNTLLSTLRNKIYSFQVNPLNVRDALRKIRSNVYPDFSSMSWSPAIPFIDSNSGKDKTRPIPTRWKNNADANDKSEFMYPNISDQIMIAGISSPSRSNKGSDVSNPLNDPTLVQVGQRLFAPLMFKLPPSETDGLTFNKLFNEINGTDTRQNGEMKALPFSFSMILESDGMSVYRFKQIFASILGIASTINKNIMSSQKTLQEKQRNGENIVKLKMSAMTWADSDNTKELLLRKRKLWKVLESWGGSTIVEKTGDPMLAFQSNSLALSHQHIGNPAPAPLSEALKLTPLTRPASEFEHTTSMMRSICGKLMPWERFSDAQTLWLNLFSGRPGTGKSATVNSMNIDACLMGGLKRLPYVGYLDIGVSSTGFISSIEDALPSHLKYLVLYKRLQNSSKDCINPFDIHLGGRYPLPHIKTFIINFITLLITPPERGTPYEGMNAIVAAAVDEVYKLKDTIEKGQPTVYTFGEFPEVDNAIEEYGIPVIEGKTPLYTLVDRLFDKGCVYEAEVAQRGAVPRLPDLASVANSPEFKARFGKISIQGNLLLDLFKFGLDTASDQYPIFNSKTQFDVGSARIIALDLQDVVVKGRDPQIMHNTTIMYMIATQCFFKKISFSEETLNFIRPEYFKYYKKLVSELIDEYKSFSIDEYHNTGGNVHLENILSAYARESRKWLLEINVLSQLPKDFGDLMSLASTIVLLEAGSKETRSFIRETVALSDVAESALQTHCNGPTKDGTTFLAIINTKKTTNFQLYTLSMGPKRLWRLSTSAEDRKLRTYLYEKMEKRDAIELLAKRFPSGGCKAYVKKLKQSIVDTQDFDDDLIETEIVLKIGNDLYQEYLNNN